MIHDTIKQRLRATLMGLSSGKKALDAAAHLASELNEDGCWIEPGYDRGEGPDSGPRKHLIRTVMLAKACHLAPGELSGPTRLALDWWLSHDFRSKDWQQDQIFVPRLVGEIALLVEDDLSSGAKGKVTEILTRSRWSHWVSGAGWTEWTGSRGLGVAYNIILRGCIESAPTLCENAFRRAFRNFRWASNAQDVARFISSSGSPHLPAVGLACVRDYARLITLAYGTPWQAPTESTKAFVTYLLDFQQWIMLRDVLDGAGSFSPETDALSTFVAQLAQLGNPPRRAELADMAERLGGRGKGLIGHRYFWQARFSVHQRPDFYSSLLLNSPRASSPDSETARYEALAGGPCFLRSGEEYTGVDGTPGSLLSPTSATTCENDWPHNAPGLQDLGTIRTVGGVGDGEYGLAAVDLQVEDVSGKKAWFFLDRAVVCLEAGISALPGGTPVLTRLNRCRLSGSVTTDAAKGATRHPLTPGRRHELSGSHQIEHGGLLYHFPEAPRLLVDLEASSDGERPPSQVEKGIFTLWIDHGMHPQGARSACFVLPLDDVPSSRNRVELEINQIEVLANGPAIQAVRDRKMGVLSVVFWEPSVLTLPDGGRIAANSPCLLLCRDHPLDTASISISNLLQRPAIVHVEHQGCCLCFELPGNAEAGRRFRFGRHL